MAQTSTSLPGTLGLVPSPVPSDQITQSALRPALRHAVGQFSPDRRLPSPARVCQSWAAVRCVWAPSFPAPPPPRAVWGLFAVSGLAPLLNPLPRMRTSTNPGPPCFSENPLRTSQTFWDRTDPRGRATTSLLCLPASHQIPGYPQVSRHTWTR